MRKQEILSEWHYVTSGKLGFYPDEYPIDFDNLGSGVVLPNITNKVCVFDMQT